MDIFEKIKITGLNESFEADGNPSALLQPTAPPCNLDQLKDRFPVTQAHLPNGHTIPLLKTMQTSVCERDCNYCCFRSGRDTPRASLTPNEMAEAVQKLTQAGIAKGVFLSSGIVRGGANVQENIIATAEILRTKYQYKDYIHLKIMPGTEKDQILKAMQLADRVSINLEAPTPQTLAKIAPHKIFFEELLNPLKWINEIRQEYPAWKNYRGYWPSSSTQFVVGCVGDTDLDLLNTTVNIRNHHQISRVYYSAFSPVSNTPFENLPPTSHWRQHRLYQAFYLLRNYQFDLEDFQFEDSQLPLDVDPKLSWANHNLLELPIEINKAEYHQLLRVPGIGPKSAKTIIQARRISTITEKITLSKMGINLSRAEKFICINGRRPVFQYTLF